MATVIVRSILLAVVLLFTATPVAAQIVTVTDAPRAFSIASPTGWTRQPPATGNSRLKFVSPPGTPYAERAVIVQELPSLRGQPQSYYDQFMAEPPDPSEMQQQLASQFSNVRAFAPGVANLSGHPAQVINVEYSAGQQWIRGVNTITGTTPGLVWTLTCGAGGKSPAEARKGFSHWQVELARFPTYLKILR